MQRFLCTLGTREEIYLASHRMFPWMCCTLPPCFSICLRALPLLQTPITRSVSTWGSSLLSQTPHPSLSVGNNLFPGKSCLEAAVPLRGFNVPCSKSTSGNLTSSSNKRAASVASGIIAWPWKGAESFNNWCYFRNSFSLINQHPPSSLETSSNWEVGWVFFCSAE